MSSKFWNQRTHRVNREQLEAQEEAAHVHWKKFWTPPQPGDVHDERHVVVHWKKNPKWFRTMSTVIALLVWTAIFLALMAPFFW